jgi:hypothetical protein
MNTDSINPQTASVLRPCLASSPQLSPTTQVMFVVYDLGASVPEMGKIREFSPLLEGRYSKGIFKEGTITSEFGQQEERGRKYVLKQKEYVLFTGEIVQFEDQ